MSQPGAPAGPWTAEAVPDQHGRTAVITGANSGIGFETARVLAERGATVVLACRDVAKARYAAEKLPAGAAVEVAHLDLASLSAVRDSAERLRSRFSRIDLLINNAGVMWPAYSRTADGFELQFGTNHLGHFALTGLLLDLLLDVPGSRVVTVSSLAHQTGTIHFDDLHSERSYSRTGAYAQSKLANLMFTYELQRRLAAAAASRATNPTPTTAVAAHPGLSRTELARHLPAWLRYLNQTAGSLFAQSSQQGALPTLRAATDPAATGGQFYGPNGFAEMRGLPRVVRSNARSHDVEVQQRLWQESERLTGVTFPV